MVETHKKRKNTVITKITLTISNGEHIKHTLSASKHDPHQQHLPKIYQTYPQPVDCVNTRMQHFNGHNLKITHSLQVIRLASDSAVVHHQLNLLHLLLTILTIYQLSQHNNSIYLERWRIVVISTNLFFYFSISSLKRDSPKYDIADILPLLTY